MMAIIVESLSVTDRPLYPIGIPEKFSASGVIQRYPGNTIICHLPADSPLTSGMYDVHNAFHISAAVPASPFLISHPVSSQGY